MPVIYRGHVYRAATYLPDSLYHVTTADRIPSISRRGLQPVSGYVYLAEPSAVQTWAEYTAEMGEIGEVADGYVPVVLEVDPGGMDDLEIDSVGSEDVPEGQAFRTPHIIPPQDLLVLNPAGKFVPLTEVTVADFASRAVAVSDDPFDPQLVHLFVPEY